MKETESSFYPVIKPFMALGLLSPVISWIGIFSAISLSPWFSWTDNALSDLGVSSAGIVFNSALIISGFLTLVFVYKLLTLYHKRPLLVVVAGLLAVTQSASIGIGVFTEYYGGLHNLLATMLFVFAFLTSLTYGIGIILTEHDLSQGILSCAIAVSGILSWFLLDFPGIAIPEAFSAALFSTWQVLFILKMSSVNNRHKIILL
ncbi:MAG: DUF998 domain-containing protein [Candidatus Ranarchaeia archaeon]